MENHKNWGIGGGLTLALGCGAVAIVFGSVAPNPEAAAMCNFISGMGALTGIVSGIAYDYTYLSRNDKNNPSKRTSSSSEIGLYSSPENSIVRNSTPFNKSEVPASIRRILDNHSKRQNYVEGLRQGANLVRDYLKELSPEEYSSVNQINIFPEQQTKLFGLPIGRKSLEVKIKR